MQFIRIRLPHRLVSSRNLRQVLSIEEYLKTPAGKISPRALG